MTTRKPKQAWSRQMVIAARMPSWIRRRVTMTLLVGVSAVIAGDLAVIASFGASVA